MKDGMPLFGKPPPATFVMLEQIGAAPASLPIAMKDKQRVLVKECMAVGMKEKDRTICSREEQKNGQIRGISFVPYLYTTWLYNPDGGHFLTPFEIFLAVG
jgi:hypothetical protein